MEGREDGRLATENGIVQPSLVFLSFSLITIKDKDILNYDLKGARITSAQYSTCR
jgi:hypothetical protein